MEPSTPKAPGTVRTARNLIVAGAGILVLLVVACAPRGDDPAIAGLPEVATFVGRGECTECHMDAYELWLGSDHDKAMDTATDDTVLGDFDNAEFTHAGITSRFYRRKDGFFVHTEGPGGEMGEFEITHTFGIEPLQQYLVPFPGGRLQALPIAWDTERERWFTLNPDTVIVPDDWLHWTRNGQNWNGMCAECHSTNLQKNLDPDSGTYATTWSEIDVSCEACHGPGGAHTKRPKKGEERTPVVQFGRGNPQQNDSLFTFAPQGAARDADRPMWAESMDANQDGDISPEEFLGDAEQFKQLDRDEDGFLSSSETGDVHPERADP